MLIKKNVTRMMLRPDLGAAGIPYVDDAGRYADFHALRHSFITHLGRTKDIHFKTAQDLARHSTPILTARYTHVFKGDEVAAINALPDFSTSGRDSAAATGTDDATADSARLALSLAQTNAKHETSTDSNRLKDDQTPTSAAHKNPRLRSEKQGFLPVESGEGGIRTRGTGKPHTGFRNRLLQPLGHLSQVKPYRRTHRQNCQIC